MTEITASAPAKTLPHYVANDYSLRSWLAPTDHKRVAVLFSGLIIAFFLLGGLAALLLRLELLTPATDIISDAVYKKAYTLHGLMMIYYGLMPFVPAVLGVFLVPLMIGAKGLAFRSLSLGSLYTYLLGGTMMLAALITGGVDTGWVFYPTLISTATNTSVVLTGLGLMLAGLSMILLAVNFIATIHKMRAPGMVWFRLPLFVWAIYLTSLLALVANPILITTTALVLIERLLHLGIFVPTYGGSIVLFQYLFWFFGHQIMYMILLPAIGLLFEVVAAFTRHPVYGYRAVVYSMMGLLGLGFISWTIHLAGNASVFLALLASLFSLLVIVPVSAILLSLIATLFRGSVSFECPMLFALGGVFLLLIGLLSGLMLATLSLAKHLSGTYFVTAHLHFAATAAVMVILGGLHYWWPKATGKMYPEGPAKVSALIFLVAAPLAMLPEFMLGYLGMSRQQSAYAPEFTVLQIAVTLGTSMLVVGYLLPPLYLTWSIFFGRRAAANPWQAKGLEWEYTASPPGADNFSETPLVTEPAYHYPQPAPVSASSGPAAIVTR